MLDYPPVIFIKRNNCGSSSKLNSCFSGFIAMALISASFIGSISYRCARKIARRSTLCSLPKQSKSLPEAVTRTRLQVSQKLWLCGEIKPILAL